ncbi:hypothetical protein [Gimesia sp.]|uniref:hypothetical protein n=1 Tax=Gimesia sp. TaxID=2024833 RepID=UPI000C64E4A1|nr:hypothetical protein [Gimesia sp.]MAX40388.1 hypothetical protein [Gimesia sp.]|tara:strand:+ start:5800 stop:7155 length:1356 start_codon:yes stop_codon:yes gene_type:complete
MSDRIHFCISCSLLLFMVGLVIAPSSSHSPLPEQPLPSQSSVETRQSVQNFLDEESAQTALVSINAGLSAKQNGDVGHYIPLNVVPENMAGKRVQQSPVTAPRPENQNQLKKQSFSRELRQKLEQTVTTANQLISQTEDTFSRGLIPLSDYHLALNLAYDTKIRAADVQNQGRAKLLLNEKRALIQKAVEQLQAFDQPAAQGWYGDLVHARLILAQTDYEIAGVSHNRDGQEAALGQITRLSDEYFSVRNEEFSVGEAGLAEYRRASRAVNIARQEQNHFRGVKDETSLMNYAEDLHQIESAVEWFSSNGAGLGRADLVDLSKANLNYVQGKYYQSQNRETESQQFFNDSLQQAKSAWELRMDQYYPRGTANLHDLTTSWILWNASGSELSELKPSQSAAIRQALTAGLDRMVNTADQITDRRGRMAGDISLVHCLKNSEFLIELENSQNK